MRPFPFVVVVAAILLHALPALAQTEDEMANLFYQACFGVTKDVTICTCVQRRTREVKGFTGLAEGKFKAEKFLRIWKKCGGSDQTFKKNMPKILAEMDRARKADPGPVKRAVRETCTKNWGGDKEHCDCVMAQMNERLRDDQWRDEKLLKRKLKGAVEDCNRDIQARKEKQERTKGKFPDEFRKRLAAACVEQGGTASQCECLVKGLEARYSAKDIQEKKTDSKADVEIMERCGLAGKKKKQEEKKSESTKRRYPDDVRKGIKDNCSGRGFEEAKCECLVKGMEARYTLDDLRQGLTDPEDDHEIMGRCGVLEKQKKAQPEKALAQDKEFVDILVKEALATCLAVGFSETQCKCQTEGLRRIYSASPTPSGEESAKQIQALLTECGMDKLPEKKENRYPEEVRKALLSACTSKGTPAKTCECLVHEFESRLSLEELGDEKKLQAVADPIAEKCGVAATPAGEPEFAGHYVIDEKLQEEELARQPGMDSLKAKTLARKMVEAGTAIKKTGNGTARMTTAGGQVFALAYEQKGKSVTFNFQGKASMMCELSGQGERLRCSDGQNTFHLIRN